jgi:hypothetical protein
VRPRCDARDRKRLEQIGELLVVVLDLRRAPECDLVRAVANPFLRFLCVFADTMPLDVGGADVAMSNAVWMVGCGSL